VSHVHIAVIGGGMNGQLVQHAIPEAEIFDWKPEPTDRQLTRSVGANYLWEPIPGLECREFLVHTRIDGFLPTLERIHSYKEKIGRNGDVEGWERQFQPEMKGYDFVALPEPRVHYDHRISSINRTQHRIAFVKHAPVTYDFLISTIPLYSLLSLLDMPEPEGGLRFKPIFTHQVPRPPDAPFPEEMMYVNYLSSPAMVPYRLCDRFGVRFYESIEPFPSGIKSRRLTPGKIFYNPRVLDVKFHLAAQGIYTLGRYGAWNPDELIHETWMNIEQWKKGVGA
jgi:hypothetical protein